MPLYVYDAFTRDGKAVSGSIDAPSAHDVRDRIVKQGLYPTRIVRVQEAGPFSFKAWLDSLFVLKVSRRDVIFFTKQLAVLLKAGVPLLQALELLVEQTEQKLQRMVIALKDTVSEGRSLADGLAQFSSTFDSTYVQLVRAGEATGKLEVILDRLVSYLERSEELRKKVKGAMMLPMIQLSVVVLIVAGILWKVVPDMAPLFNNPDMKLPVQTKMLLALSNALVNHGFAILMGIVGSIGLFLWWKSTPSGRRRWDALVLKIPLFGYFVRMRAVVQFTSTLGMLIESDVNLAESLSIVTQLIDNRVLVDTLHAAREKIIQQGRITIYLKETGLFPPVALYLLRTGEESGQLGHMLLTVAQTYDAELRETADQLAAQLNPIMLLVMGGIVAFVVVAIGKPILSMGDMVQQGVANRPRM